MMVCWLAGQYLMRCDSVCGYRITAKEPLPCTMEYLLRSHRAAAGTGGAVQMLRRLLSCLQVPEFNRRLTNDNALLR